MFINPYLTYPTSSISSSRRRSTSLHYHFGRRSAIGEKHEHMFLRVLGKAMQYYRLWIYSCNLALFIGTFIYLIAFITVITDSKLTLFPNIRLYHPSFIYAYLAIIMQGGLVQAIGCLGALKLNESYLHLYLLTMSILVFGDAIMGVVWTLRYKSLILNLKNDLKNQIFLEYDTNMDLQNVWNDIQANWNCCGVDGPSDYNISTWAMRYLPAVIEEDSKSMVLPLSCCHPEEPTFGPPHNECITRMNEHVFSKGCYDDIYQWLQSSTDLLLVLGFCVITFIKLCFLFLLKSEIKEMIEKIKMIKGESENGCSGSGGPGGGHMLPFQDLEAYLPRPSMQQDTLLNNPSSSCVGVAAEGGGIGRGLTTQQQTSAYRGNSITEKCHCRLGGGGIGGFGGGNTQTTTTNLVNTLSGSRTILSYSTANLSGCQSSKKHSLV